MHFFALSINLLLKVFSTIKIALPCLQIEYPEFKATSKITEMLKKNIRGYDLASILYVLEYTYQQISLVWSIRAVQTEMKWGVLCNVAWRTAVMDNKSWIQVLFDHKSYSRLFARVKSIRLQFNREQCGRSGNRYHFAK